MFNVAAFGQIVNVNLKKRQVTGVMTLEVEDKNNRWVMDYEESKPHFIAWSHEIHNASGGLSYGNVRLMHTLENVGKVAYELKFDDEAKKIYCTADVSDDKAWEKVQNGELCGFSWSGIKVPPTPEVLKKWANLPDGSRRYIGKPFELSLVDNPNQPGAYFSVVNSAGVPVYTVEKENGETEEHTFNVQNAATLYDISDLASKLANLKWTFTGEDDLQVEFNKAFAKLLSILQKMVKDVKSEFPVEEHLTAANAATGENEMDEKKVEAVVNTPNTGNPNGVTIESISNATSANTESITALTALVTSLVTSVGELKSTVEKVQNSVPAPTAATVVTKEGDNKAPLVAEAPKAEQTVESIMNTMKCSEEDAKHILKIQNIGKAQ
jgi:Sec-independent protein translocase protein TatA